MSSSAFNVRKIVQVSSLIMSKCPGGQIEHVKLMKLLYMVDRLAIKQLGFPLSDDKYYSMAKGPILSHTLNLINGKYEETGQAEWSATIGKLSPGFVLRLEKPIDELSFEELSDAEIQLVETICDEFGSTDVWELVEWTHNNFPEWEDPGSSRSPISIEALVGNLGLGAEESKELLEHLQEREAFESVFLRS